MYYQQIDRTLLNGVTVATTGESTQFLTGRYTERVRYFIRSVGSTVATVAFQQSFDGVNWASAVAVVSNPGTAETTGTIDGPVKFVRAVTTGATHGTISVFVIGAVAA
jgi:hypothetical protein